MTTPTAPIITYAPRASNQQLEYQWEAPLSEGSSPITGYRLTLDDGITPIVNTYGAAVRYASVTGLTNGTLYTTTIEATNDSGSTYGPGASFRPFEPGNGVPGEPASVSATAGPGYTSAIVEWTAPASTPDSTIFWYVIESQSSDPADPVIKRTADGLTQTSLYITGLNPASTYTFRVCAVNCPGYGPRVVTNSVGPPAATGVSVDFDATGDYFTMSPGITPGTGDFSIDGWFKINTLGSGFTSHYILGGSGAPTFLYFVISYSTGVPFYQLTVGQPISNNAYSIPAIVAGTWYYVAFSRESSVTRVWIGTTPGGTASTAGGGTQSDSRDYNVVTNSINYNGGNSTATQYTNIRVQIGTSLFSTSSSTIPIPSTTITGDANTQLLLLADTSGTITTDSSGTQTITSYGSPSWSSSTPYP
jgi:hypothetical protein